MNQIACPTCEIPKRSQTCSVTSVRARSLLRKKESRSAAELSDCAGVSEPTVYRQLERFREDDLAAEDIQPVTDGKNYKLYQTEIEGIELDLSEDGLEITISRRERMADRFTQFVEGT